MHKIEPASDPKWADEQYRTARLLGLIDLHGLTSKDVADLTNKSVSMVKQWRQQKTRNRTIPTEVLRSLIYDLQAVVE